MSAPATVLFVHGATLGGWSWDPLRDELARRGVASSAVDLPSCGPSPSGLRGLRADARQVREALDALGGPVVVCGHSYGGVPMTEGAAGHERVRHLVYLAAFMLDEGESTSSVFAENHTERSRTAFDIHQDGTFSVNRAAAPAFTGNLPPDFLRMFARAGFQSVASLLAPPAAIAWKSIPSTYVVARNDALVSPITQSRLAQRATKRIDCDSNHFPQLERLSFVADLLEQLAQGAAP